MSGFLKALGGFALAIVLAQPAYAQDATWTEPDGRFSLAFRDLGWTAMPADRAAAAGDLLIIVRDDSLRDNRTRICALSQRPPHNLEGGQETANVYLDRVTASDVQQNVGQPVANLTHARVNGVATLDYTVLLNGTQMRTRDFVLASDGRMIVFDITCGTPPPTTDDEAASISAVLDSLAILPRAQPTSAEVASGWELRAPTPGAPPCRAVRFGATVDTQLLRNREGRLVLIAGHPDWNHSGAAVQASISIDDAPPASVTGFPIGPVFLVLTTEEQLARLRDAHTLHWSLPWGEFSADVSGLGSAFDAIAVCPG